MNDSEIIVLVGEDLIHGQQYIYLDIISLDFFPWRELQDLVYASETQKMRVGTDL